VKCTSRCVGATPTLKFIDSNTYTTITKKKNYT